MPEQEPFVPIDDVARHFSVSTSTVRSWIKNNHIPRDTFVKLGNTYRFQISAVTAALTGAAVPEEGATEDEPDLADWVDDLPADEEGSDDNFNLDDDL
jgi:excisionase family DNA binding protein